MGKYILIFGFAIIWFFPVRLVIAEPLAVPDLDEIEYPDDDAPSQLKIKLGKTLFFDPRLSANNNISCATCHNPDLGFGDGMAKGIGTSGNLLGRNAPHLYNLAWNSVFLWDGRSDSLEKQALGPIAAKAVMNLPHSQLVARLKKVPYYAKAFRKIFPGSKITKEKIAAAIAAFERSIITRNSPFDRYMRGDKSAMSAEAIRGKAIFEGKANCIICHDGANFTDEGFYNIGLVGKDPGRAKIAPGPLANGAFKTPGLRNVLLTGPYMHDGSLESLEDVIRHYNKGGTQKAGISPDIKPLHLKEREILNLVAFLGALTEIAKFERPTIP